MDKLKGKKQRMTEEEYKIAHDEFECENIWSIEEKISELEKRIECIEIWRGLRASPNNPVVHHSPIFRYSAPENCHGLDVFTKGDLKDD